MKGFEVSSAAAGARRLGGQLLNAGVRNLDPRKIDFRNITLNTLSVKLPAMMVSLGVAIAVLVGALGFVFARDALIQSEREKLIGLAAARAGELQRTFSSIAEDMRYQNENPTILNAMRDLRLAWAESERLGGDPARELRTLYIDENPNPQGMRDELDAAEDGSAYSDSHLVYHPAIRSFLYERGYYDAYLVDTDGNVIYSVFKEDDFGTNLNDGKWADTGLGKAFRAAISNTSAMYFSDMEPYAANAGVPTSFLAKAIVDEWVGTIEGALIIQLPMDRINTVMQSSEGLGDTGETFIVGADKLMRSQTRFNQVEQTVLTRQVDNAAVEAGLAGEQGAMQTVNHAGVDVMSAYVPVDFNEVNYNSMHMPIDFNDAQWLVVAERNLDEILAPVNDLAFNTFRITIFAILGMAVLAVITSRRIARPIGDMTDVMTDLSAGKTEVEIPAQNRKDEIGAMAKAVQFFKDNLIRVRRMEEEAKEAEKAAAEEKKAMMNRMADEFEASVKSIVDGFAAAATEMQASSESLTSTAEQTNSQAETVAAAADEASANVQTVSAATEELAASIQEISRQASDSARNAHAAVDQAQSTSSQIRGLQEAALRIGEVVNLISDIAGQTNLLALNATIEAARAGEAGKGFAVVASEVKALASQTAKATEDISAQVAQIQGETEGAVTAIGGIASTIAELNETATAIAAAVEEQGAATQEIGRNSQDAATGTRQVSDAILSVTQAATETGQGANQVLSAAGDLSQQSEALRAEVERFIATVRAA